MLHRGTPGYTGVSRYRGIAGIATCSKSRRALRLSLVVKYVLQSLILSNITTGHWSLATGHSWLVVFVEYFILFLWGSIGVCVTVSATSCGFDSHSRKLNDEYFHFLALVTRQIKALNDINK